MATEHVTTWQRTIGVNADGDFGPRTLARSLELLPAQPAPSGAPLSAKSVALLVGVHPALRSVVERAALALPFVVLEGLRSQERQAELFARGASWTMDSRHRTGHATDLAPLDDGQPSWQWEDYYALALAMRNAAIALDVTIVWGGCFDRVLNELSDDMLAERDAYSARCRAIGKKPRLDGPHFELDRGDYP